MRDQWEARISVIENIQEEFGHDIREIKERLVRLTNYFENHIKTKAVHSRGPSPFPNQQVPRPFVQTTSYLPRGTDRPNLRQPKPTARLLSRQHLDLPISQAAQWANIADKRLTRKSSNETLSPSLTSSYSQG